MSGLWRLEGSLGHRFSPSTLSETDLCCLLLHMSGWLAWKCIGILLSLPGVLEQKPQNCRLILCYVCLAWVWGIPAQVLMFVWPKILSIFKRKPIHLLWSFSLFSPFGLFVIGSYSVAQASPKYKGLLLPLPPKCSDYNLKHYTHTQLRPFSYLHVCLCPCAQRAFSQ